MIWLLKNTITWENGWITKPIGDWCLSFNNGLPGTLQEASWPWVAWGELPGKEEPLGGLAHKVTLPLAQSQALPGMGYHMALIKMTKSNKWQNCTKQWEITKICLLLLMKINQKRNCTMHGMPGSWLLWRGTLLSRHHSPHWPNRSSADVSLPCAGDLTLVAW